MKRRCAWLNSCPQPVARRVASWGAWFDLCAEHGDLIGDDGSMDEPVAQAS